MFSLPSRLLSAIALVLSATASTALCENKVHRSDWAEMAYPSQARVGTEVDVQITVTEAHPEGTVLAADLYWMKADGGFGGLLSYGQRKTFSEGKPVNFRFKVGEKAGMGSVQVTAFTSPDGDWNSRKQVIVGPGMSLDKSGAPAATSSLVGEQLDWASIEYPAAVAVGDTMPVKLKIKEPIPAGSQLAADLYWMKADGNFGGLLSFGLRQPADTGKTHTVMLKVGEKPGMGSVQVTAFLSPDGSWDSRQQVIRGPAVPVAAASAVEQSASSGTPDGVTFKKSWLSMKIPEGPFQEGDSFSVEVEYYLDPTETWGAGTELFLSAHGPWVDNPDGTYTKTRSHHAIPGLTGTKGAAIEPGRGSRTFDYTVPELHRFNDLLFIAGFKMDGGAQNWPWNLRGEGPVLRKTHSFYDLETDKVGNLFTYGEPLVIKIVSREGAVSGETKQLRYTITDTDGRTVVGERSFTSVDPDGEVAIELPYGLRGTFVLKASVEGWGEREMVFAYIPDVAEIVGDTPTAFGVTNVETEAENAVARKLGFSWVRHFFSWSEVRPAEDFWNLEQWDAVLERNKAFGLEPWLCLVYPPAWVQTGNPRNVPYVPYGFDYDALTTTVEELSARWSDLIWGWEWQNEIVPGDLVENPVENYINFNRVGTTAVRASAPDLKVQLAGGLWPRNFRNDLLKQGVAQYIDVLPVHYGNYDSVRDAQKDLAVVGEKERVAVWDNESSSGLSVWKMPLTEMVQVESQSEWIMQRWAAELSAGVEQITLFGGHVAPAGNWSYLLDDRTVRPYATTAAVFISKLAHAEPLGTFYFDQGGMAHLFDRSGEAVLVLSAPAKAARLKLPVGSTRLTVTDHQGREQILSADAGDLAIELSPTPVFLEGAQLDVLKTQLVLNLGAADRPIASPQVTAVRSSGLTVPVQLKNPYDRELKVGIGLRPESSRQPVESRRVTLAPGAGRSIEVAVSSLPASQNSSGAEPWVAVVEFPGTSLDPVQRPFTVAWVEPAYLGNLLENPGFEDGTSPWFISGKGRRVDSGGALGTGQTVLELASDEGGWMASSQEIEAPSGQSYLFSLWAHPDGLQQGGANITYVLPEGRKKELYIPHVFQTPSDSDSWMLMSYRGTVPENAEKVQFIPVANGGDDGGRMLVDNVRVSLYQGSNYAAEASRVTAALRIDGDLSEWDRACPVPLLAVNQLIAIDEAYDWSPENLSGVAYLQWDDDALFLAVEVIDDQAVQPATGDRTVESDSLTLALQPARLGEASNDRAFAFYLSSASPGGGSGRYTLFRPEAYAGGLVSGHLAKDSSAYEIAIRREENRTFYEVRFPWSELGGVRPQLGTRLGVSLRLVDNDGKGPVAKMLWGEGLDPVWEPSQFGLLTLVK